MVTSCLVPMDLLTLQNLAASFLMRAVSSPFSFLDALLNASLSSSLPFLLRWVWCLDQVLLFSAVVIFFCSSLAASCSSSLVSAICLILSWRDSYPNFCKLCFFKTFFQRFPLCRDWLPLCRGVLPLGKGLIPLPRGLFPLCRGWFHCLFHSLHWLPHCCKNKRAVQKELWYQNGCNAIWFWVHVFWALFVFQCVLFPWACGDKKNSSDETWWNLMKPDEIWWKHGFNQISSDFIRKLKFVFSIHVLIKLGILGLKLQCNPFARVWNLHQLEKPTDNHWVTHQIWSPNYQTFVSKNCLLIRFFFCCFFEVLYRLVC